MHRPDDPDVGKPAGTAAAEHQPDRTAADVTSKAGNVAGNALTKMEVVCEAVIVEPFCRARRMARRRALQEHQLERRGRQRVDAVAGDIADRTHIAPR